MPNCTIRTFSRCPDAITTPSKIPIRIGTELSSHKLHVPPSRLYPSKQMLHNGPVVPGKHASIISILELAWQLYVGKISEGDENEGKGTFTCEETGTIYEGEFKFNKIHGHGTMTFTDGSKFDDERPESDVDTKTSSPRSSLSTPRLTPRMKTPRSSLDTNNTSNIILGPIKPTSFATTKSSNKTEELMRKVITCGTDTVILGMVLETMPHASCLKMLEQYVVDVLKPNKLILAAAKRRSNCGSPQCQLL